MYEEGSLVHRLRAGWAVSDDEFDGIYPDWVRKVSESHWTPIEVARRAAELLAVGPHVKILDVGSGAGKFCVVAASVTDGTFVGVEQRGKLVEIARQAAQRCGTPRARFLHNNAMSVDWSEFDGFYLFNPFYEFIARSLTPIEEPVVLSRERYTEYVVATAVKLFTARVGARVVTYHGFGGPMPIGYRRLLREPVGSQYLELWEKKPC
jgi:hypothetical protein